MSRTSSRRRRTPPDPAEFIRGNTRLTAVPTVPEIRLHTAHEATGLWRIASRDKSGDDAPPPYWAFPWAGGMALARYLLDRPAAVRGQSVLDLGSGSGLVAIAAGLTGARPVYASEIDPYGLAAIALNAVSNGVEVTIVPGDMIGQSVPPPVDVVLVGDLFYDRGLAERTLSFLDRCQNAGASVLIGDPRRAHLPLSRLRLLAEYAVPDVGKVEGAGAGMAGVFQLCSPTSPPA